MEKLFIAAVDGFRAIDSRYWLAVTLCEYGEWLARVERSAEAEVIIEGSTALFAEMDAEPWLARTGRLRASVVQTAG